MPFLSGAYKRLQSWRARAAAGAPISPVEFDADGDDVALALSDCLLRDGTSVPTADLPMNSHALTGLRPGAATGESVTYDQLLASQSATNRLHNSGFAVNQRGVSGTVQLAAGAYGHDRWKAGSGGCTYTYAQNGPDFAITIQSGSLLQIVHPLDVIGGPYTVSQDAAGTAPARIYQGTVGSGFAACPVTATGLNGGVATTVEFGPGTILRPQLANGTGALAYNRKSIATEIEACFSFYEMQQVNYRQMNSSGSGAGLGFTATYHPKVAVPTIAGLTAGGQISGSVAITSIGLSSAVVNVVSSGQGVAFVTGTMTVSADL